LAALYLALKSLVYYTTNKHLRGFFYNSLFYTWHLFGAQRLIEKKKYGNRKLNKLLQCIVHIPFFEFLERNKIGLPYFFVSCLGVLMGTSQTRILNQNILK